MTDLLRETFSCMNDCTNKVLEQKCLFSTDLAPGQVGRYLINNLSLYCSVNYNHYYFVLNAFSFTLYLEMC